MNQAFHRRGIEGGELFRVTLDFLKKTFIADARHLHGLDVAGAFVIGREGGEQFEIVDDRVRRRETCR